ncbi:MAG: methyl-accepting chemotaxis protein, partial [Desulfovibrionaceae bacterium]
MARESAGLGIGGKVWILGVVWLVLLAAAASVGQMWAAAAAGVIGLAATAGFSAWSSKPMKSLARAGREYLATGDEKELRGVSGDAAEPAAVLLEAASKANKMDFYQGAIQAVGNPLLVCDAGGIIVFASDSLLDILRKKQGDVIGVTVSEAFYNKKGVSVTEQVMESGKPVKKEVDIHLWDGRELPVALSTDIIRGTRGELLGAVSSFVDLSKVKDQERAALEEKDRMDKVGSDISELAQRVASASEELSASADEQANGAQAQKRQTDTVATSMEEMTATVLEVARNASATSQAADDAQVSAREGVDLVSKAVDGINKVSDSAGKLSTVLSELNGHAGEIGRIIGVINDIADQTNLLALNAAIEAARAG